MSVHVHIRELVLEGLAIDAGAGDAVRAAVEAELTRLFADGGATGGLVGAGGARSNVAAPEIHATGDESPTTLGQRIGRAVYGGIGR